jgi:hypothetical protein
MFRSQFIGSSIVCLKICLLCVVDTPFLAQYCMSNMTVFACWWWCVLDVLLGFPGTVLWKWFVSVMRCKDLYWVGPCRKSNLNLWTQKWLFLYTVNMKSHQKWEEQKSYQWKFHTLHKKMKLMPCMRGSYCYKDFHHSYRGVQVMFMCAVQTTFIGILFLLLTLNIKTLSHETSFGVQWFETGSL